MFKFVATVVFLTSVACAAPVDSKVESQSNNDSGAKMNGTEDVSKASKSAMPHYNSGASNYMAGYPMPASYYSPAPAAYYAAPPLVNSLNKPLTTSSYSSNDYSYPSSAYSYPSGYSYPSAYSRVGAIVGEPKTHLRPQLYQSQSQPQIIALPIQTLPAQSYSAQSYPYGASYTPSYYGNYGGYGYYREAKKMADREQMMMQPDPTLVQSSAQSAPATIFVEKQVSDQPAEQMGTGADQQMSNTVPRDASGYFGAAGSSVPFMALAPDSYSQLDDLRRHVAPIDERYNLRTQPTNLMDRLHLQRLQPGNTVVTTRSADDLPEFTPAAGSEDDVYIVMNQYDQRSANARAAHDDSAAFFQPIIENSQLAPLQSMWLQPTWNTVAETAPYLRNNRNLPYTHAGIMNSLQKYYADHYNRQMLRANQKLQKETPRRASENQFLLSLADEVFKKLEKETASKKVEVSQPTKIDEKKEITTVDPKA